MARSEDIKRLTAAMQAGGGSRAEAFFLAHGLDVAFNSVGRGYGVLKHVNEPWGRARQQGCLDEVVADGLVEYGLVDPATLQESATTSGGPAVTTISSTSRVFISHASVDKELAEAVADLLRLGTGLAHTRILCTSLDGMAIPIGTTDYLEFLRTQISGAGLVLPLLTPAFFDSEACLIEIGAMWGLSIPAFPLLVPPIEFARIEKLLGKIQGAKITDSSGLSELHDKVTRTFGLDVETAMWEGKKAKFLTFFPACSVGLRQARG